jgi:hypothetical protein
LSERDKQGQPDTGDGSASARSPIGVATDARSGGATTVKSTVPLPRSESVSSIPEVEQAQALLDDPETIVAGVSE